MTEKNGQIVSDKAKKWRDQNISIIPGSKPPEDINNSCLQTVVALWALSNPHLWTPNANKAFLAVPKKLIRLDPTKAPVGAVHWYVSRTGKGDGHVTIQSDVKWHEWSTDTPHPNHVGLQAHDYFTHSWGWNLYYRGWSPWLEGITLPVKALPTKLPSGPPHK